jgi:hypothetical protein
MIKSNSKGEYIDCFAHDDKGFKAMCTALTDWYNSNGLTNRCSGCPFYKSKKQFEYEKLMYPVVKCNKF